jgi:hypothetical protein
MTGIRTIIPSALVANGIILGVLALEVGLNVFQPDLYFRSVQEDEFLEWGTFWSFASAAAVFLWAASLQRRKEGRIPWFFVAVALFCLFVAGEEISWGQRLFGYRPTPYFLEHNFQQEVNLHNLVRTALRKASLSGIVICYGIVLPLLRVMSLFRRWLSQSVIVAPPLYLLPSFAVMVAFYITYPMRYTGEVVEVILGLAFLFSGIQAVGDLGGWTARRCLRSLTASFAVVLVLGVATSALSRWHQRGETWRVGRAEKEIAALRKDFLASLGVGEGLKEITCGSNKRYYRHKRIYSYVESYGIDDLDAGIYASLVDQGLTEERAAFFIDPWNNPYWLRDDCDEVEGKRKMVIYSFGPDRRRESVVWEIEGDDVGTLFSLEEE